MRLVISSMGCWEDLSPAPPGARAEEEAALGAPSLLSLTQFLCVSFQAGVSTWALFVPWGRQVV